MGGALSAGSHSLPGPGPCFAVSHRDKVASCSPASSVWAGCSYFVLCKRGLFALFFIRFLKGHCVCYGPMPSETKDALAARWGEPGPQPSDELARTAVESRAVRPPLALSPLKRGSYCRHRSNWLFPLPWSGHVLEFKLSGEDGSRSVLVRCGCSLLSVVCHALRLSKSLLLVALPEGVTSAFL